MRAVRLAAVAIVTVGALALSGCSAEQVDRGGAAVDAVRVAGAYGDLPNVEMPTPLIASKTQCKTLIPGDGKPLVDNQLVSMELSIYNGRTGKLANRTSYDGTSPLSVLYADTLLPGLRKGLACATEGSRVIMAIPPADAFKEAGNLDWGVLADDTLVMVADIVKTYLPRANGAPQLSQDGMPMVVLAPNGQPGITVPKGAAPKDERISVLKQGDGEVVKSGDTVTVHYTGALWDSGNVFDSSWEKKKPAQFQVGDGVTAQGGVIQGFSNALIGQKVGSQVLAVIPPELAYGENASGAIPANATLVFVIDILGVN